ncbi:asparagine synthase (glutamine-hydrolyzing) [Methanolinea mesophila]|uniref:asparagine synthase C-terminal domain-containing protein n=1 Tax=Methanolinea mesophila TaxID=547055 RepID=UPI001AEA30FB|nr:asparagine synthase C-terminal domain-containing protein [Methanolinea mesophila]MBP1929774.1 asparagine synthase (glutamine-hydrolyzing) [Methanolinea mesophila]
MSLFIRGWVEDEGRRLTEGEIEAILSDQPSRVSRFGGEFFFSSGVCEGRDHLGIIPGPIPPGTFRCGNMETRISPCVPDLTLEEAVVKAVSLRSDEGVCALSGGVDSSLVAALAGLPCLVVGTASSHDIVRAGAVARVLGLEITVAVIPPGQIEDAIHSVLPVIPVNGPVDVAIAVTQFFIARAARELGHSRILTGQGADELFGGYARYLTVEDVESQLEADFGSLALQGARDQAVAGLHGTSLSMPYLDLRVVNAAKMLPDRGKVTGGVRKRALRELAARFIPPEIAWYEKKAMQYGSGIEKEIRALARRKGFRNTGDFIRNLS